MLVTQTEDHITHAVIGGEETIDFGISNNAEFFQILSSSLYTDQIMAVVREVMCNAWDAHIESNNQDKHIHVSLTNGQFVVRDFGAGIPKNNIKTVYGVYGQSTKRMNGQVTGGFGLGCKSPFAYQDHFEVTSWNQGEQTIYALCRSASDSNGKPGITPIVSLPTEETGLQVTVATKIGDVRLFKRYIKHVASHGEMKVLFTDEDAKQEELEVIPYSKAKHGFTIINWSLFDFAAPINIRYGNVIYPLFNNTAAIVQEYAQAEKALNYINYGRRNAALILQAEPNSICVAPSREALSMQDKTVESVRKLLMGFVNKTTSTAFDQTVKTVINSTIKSVVANADSDPDKLWKQDLSGFRKSLNIAQSFEEVAQFAICNGHVTIPKHKLAKRLPQLYSKEQRGTAQSLYKFLGKGGTKEKWYTEKVLPKLITFMSKHARDLVKPKFLTTNSSSWSRTTHNISDNLSDVSFYYKTEKNLVKKVVILTCAISRVKTRLDDWPENVSGCVCLVQPISRTNPDLDKLRDALSKRRDITFIDFTIKHDWEIDDSLAKPVYVKKPKGLVKLNRILEGYLPRNGNDSLKETDYITEPLFTYKIGRGDLAVDYVWSHTLFRQFVRKYGEFGGICVTNVSEASYREKGAVSLMEFAYQKMYKHLINSKKVARYLDIAKQVSHGNAMLNCIHRVTDLAKQFGLYTELTEEDHFFINLYRSLPANDHRAVELSIAFSKTKEYSCIKKLQEAAETDLFIKYVDQHSFSNLLSSTKPELAKEREKAIALLKSKLI